MTITTPAEVDTSRLLHAASKAVDAASAEGIAVDHVSITTSLGVRVHPADPSLTPALALALGLTRRHIGLHGDGPVEFFDGECDDVAFATHWQLPADVALWTYRYTNDSEPRDHEGFDSRRGFTSYDAAVDAARDALGQQGWGQSSGNEFSYQDRYGRTGYVYVQAVAR